MWKRKEVKARGRKALKANYWRCVLVTLILLAITGGSGHVTGGAAGGSTAGLANQYISSVETDIPADLPAEAEENDPAEAAVNDPAEAAVNEPAEAAVNEPAEAAVSAPADAAANEPAEAAEGKTVEFPPTGNPDLDAALESLSEDPSFNSAMEQLMSAAPQAADLMEQLLQLGWEAIAVIAAIIGGILLIIVVIAFLIKLLIINPLLVGCRYYFAHNAVEKAPLGDLAEGFECGFGRVVKTMFLKDLFLFFWTLLFIIPGIIKAYSYRMVPYILADQPDLGGTAAITRSREMMKGNKWRTFVFDLSFILWRLLSLLTLGILGVFYVNPYYQSANGALYQALKLTGSDEGPYEAVPPAPVTDEGPFSPVPPAPVTDEGPIEPVPPAPVLDEGPFEAAPPMPAPDGSDGVETGLPVWTDLE